MLRWLVYLVIAILLLALITAPTEREFRSYVYAQAPDTTLCKPLIQYRSYHLMYFDLFSINTVKEYFSNDGLLPKEGLAFDKSPRLAEKHRYLGLFGTFWKL
jgi:hypothetical protein